MGLMTGSSNLPSDLMGDASKVASPPVESVLRVRSDGGVFHGEVFIDGLADATCELGSSIADMLREG